MQTPSLTPTYLIALVVSVVALFVTQNLITNGVGQFVTGLASVLIPLVFAAIKTARENAQAHVSSRVEAARIHAAAVQTAHSGSAPRAVTSK